MATLPKFRVLILTEHRIHSPVESIYHIARNLSSHPKCAYVHVVSRGVKENEDFFVIPRDMELKAVVVDSHFCHSKEGEAFSGNLLTVSPLDYDVVFLRLPRVNSMLFFARIDQLIPAASIINRPKGIIETGNKEYLLNFPELCPPIRYCDSIDEVLAFASQFPIVLKPLNNSGGKGIVRIDGKRVLIGEDEYSWEAFLPRLAKEISKGYLGMKFLKNVGQGDKRIIVVNEEIVAASLRKPPKGSWLCNVSMGGSSELATPAPEELAMAEILIPHLLKNGIVMFGFDTLVDDDGKRVLSEINTSCVNGLYPAELHSGKPVTAIAANLLNTYIENNIFNHRS